MAAGTLGQASRFPPWSITLLVFVKHVPPTRSGGAILGVKDPQITRLDDLQISG